VKRIAFFGISELHLEKIARVGSWFFLLLMSAFPLWVAQRQPLSLNDDTYITLTYAKSLANGKGFVFNHPPATLGTTTPLFTLVNAGLSWLLPGVELSRIAVVFTALCWTGIAWTIYLGYKSLSISRWQAVIIGNIVIASGWIGFLGMEAYLFAFLLVVGVVVYFQERWLLTGVIVGLLFLTRGEGLLLLPTFMLYRLGEIWNREQRWHSLIDSSWLKILLGCSIVILIWSLYAWDTFGQILPNTLSAKMAQKEAGHWRSFPYRLLTEWMPTWGQQFALLGCSALNLWWILVITGTVYVLFKNKQWVILLIWISFYIIGYTVLDVAAYWWYQLPILFVLQIMVALGLVAIQEYTAKLGGKLNYLGYVISITLTLVVALLLVRPRIDSVIHSAGDPRASSYLALADWFNENTEPSQSVAYVEIGYLGYYTENQIIDLMGLITPSITPHIAEGDFASGFWEHQPDYFVYLPDFDWALTKIRNDSRFEQSYQSVTTVTGPRETDFVIYKLVDVSG
jgi:hypothetical protein